MFSHLLVPIDGGALAEHAVEAAIELARKLDAQITAFIAEPPVPAAGYGAAGFVQRMEAHDRETHDHAQRVLDDFRARAEGAGVAFDGVYARSSRIVDAILEAAQERGCDLIVMATHVHGFLGELLAASHTKAVMARSKVPLLVLH